MDLAWLGPIGILVALMLVWYFRARGAGKFAAWERCHGNAAGVVLVSAVLTSIALGLLAVPYVLVMALVFGRPWDMFILAAIWLLVGVLFLRAAARRADGATAN